MTVKERMEELKSQTAERRRVAQDAFDAFRETAEIAASSMAGVISRDAKLQQMLANIRVNLPGVVYGDAPKVPSHGLNAPLPEKSSEITYS